MQETYDATTAFPVEVNEVDGHPRNKIASAGCDMRRATDALTNEVPLVRATGEQDPGAELTKGEVMPQKSKELAVAAEQGDPGAVPHETMAALPHTKIQIEEETTKATDEKGAGESERGQDPEGRRSKLEGQESAKSPVSSCGGRPDVLKDKLCPNDSAASVRLQPGATSSPTTAHPSTDSDHPAKVPLQCGEDGNVAAMIRWRGQPVTLTAPIVVTLTESNPSYPRREQEGGGRDCRRRGEGVGERRRIQRVRALHRSSESVEDENSDASLVARKGESSKPLRRGANCRGRGDAKREVKLRGESKHEPSSSEEEGKQELFQRDVHITRHSRGPGAKTSRKNGKSRRRRGGEALPLCPSSSARSTAFLAEPYFGPPVAELPRAWPEGTSMMADAMENGHRRRCGRGNSLGHKGD